MTKEQVERFNRGRRLVGELNELAGRYQKLNFYLDTTEEIDVLSEAVLGKQSETMKEYIDILINRLENSLY